MATKVVRVHSLTTESQAVRSVVLQCDHLRAQRRPRDSRRSEPDHKCISAAHSSEVPEWNKSGHASARRNRRRNNNAIHANAVCAEECASSTRRENKERTLKRWEARAHVRSRESGRARPFNPCADSKQLDANVKGSAGKTRGRKDQPTGEKRHRCGTARLFSTWCK